MSNTFMGIEIGKRSVITHQLALNITGHNIANANTIGYSRQAANLVTTNPWHTPVLTDNSKIGQLGTGVEVADIQRYRDAFLDSQIRKETCTLGYWDGMQESLARIEGILNEPNDKGLRGVMDQYWKSWQDLSGKAEDESARSVVVERAIGMAESFNHAYRQLTDLRDDVNSTVKVKVDEINSNIKQIRDLNQQIMAITIAGKQPNDLLDKRDLLIDDLSNLVEITVTNDLNRAAENDMSGLVPKYNGMVSVQMSGHTLVQGNEIGELDIEEDSQGMYLVVWKDTKIKANIDGGELRGLLDMRGKTLSNKEKDPSEYKEIIPTMISKLNQLAQTIMQRTNDVHRSGFSLNNKGAYPDGQNFFAVPDPLNFDGNWARAMQVDATVKNDIRSIAAASYRTWNNDVKVNFGDGSNALKIAQLKQDLNHPEYEVQTEALDSIITFPSNSISGYLTINYNNDSGTAQPPVSIYLAPPAKPYQDIQQVAAAIQEQLKTNSTLLSDKITVNVRCDGKKISFYSNSSKFQGVNNGDASGISPLLSTATIGALLPAADPPIIQDATADDFWRGICGDIGVKSQEAKRMVKNQDTLIGELENKRQSVSGVSLDEEMTNMIRFQHAYNAASRFITTMDEQLQTIITGMGLVGR